MSGSSVIIFPSKSLAPIQSLPSALPGGRFPLQSRSPLRTPLPTAQRSLVVMVLEAGGPQLVPRRARTVTWYSCPGASPLWS